MKRLTCSIVLALLGLLVPGTVPAQEPSPATVVYLVRHAETADDGTRDPALSAAGEDRAGRLARMLAGAGLTAVHTTPYRRTRQTAGAVARDAGVTVAEYDPGALEAFATKLRGAGGRHLVVGHSNTTPALVERLGGDPGGPIPEDEYGRVYRLDIGDDGVTTAILGYPGGSLADPPAASTFSPADPSDVETVESLLAALYDAISGPAGEARDWDRLRGLFLPTARLIPVQRTPDGRVVRRAMTVEEYIGSSGPVIERMGFREHEVARRMERFGDVAHVFSTYAGYREGETEPFLEGLNSIQLVYDGDRWWIASLAWSPARLDLPIPPRYRGPAQD